jgi:DNA-directed RNA polymerase
MDYFSWSHWGMYEHEVAHLLMKGPFDREIIKPAAVGEFYGSSAGGWKDGQWVGMTRSVVEILISRGKKRLVHAAPKLAAEIYRAIGALAPEARTLRNWLRKIASMCADKNKPLRFTTPLGLPFINAYHEPDLKNISVKLKGRKRSVMFAIGDKPEVSEKAAVKAAAANLIHCLDASHLQLVALAAAKEGMEIVTVHDCFGTIAPHAARLKEIIAEQFVFMHVHHDLLADVHAWASRVLGNDTPPIPKIGNAEIEDTLKSFRAFS